MHRIFKDIRICHEKERKGKERKGEESYLRREMKIEEIFQV